MPNVELKARDPAKSEQWRNAVRIILAYMDDIQWQAMKADNYEARVARFVRNYYISVETSDRISRDHAKMVRKLRHKELKKSANLKEGEMCANCFVLERTLENGAKLSKCSRCKQIKYCSRTCQAQHWKKIHKQQCKVPASDTM
jgi:sulfur relay (sulfurtransferase) DsrC/TusE family protein